MRPPVAGVARSPMQGVMPADMKPVLVGSRIVDLRPDESMVICRINGEWLSRMTPEEHEHYEALLAAGKRIEAESFEALCVRCGHGWEYCVEQGDVVEWFPVPQDREGVRTVLTIATLVVAIAFPALLPYFALATFAYNVLLPPRTPQLPNLQQASDVFTTSLSGNQAKLNQPIWKVCGRRKITPPFAAMPYQEFVSDGTDVDNKQYYFALFAATLGNCDLERALIGDTPIEHFQDVTAAQLLAPTVLPSSVKANVETSTVVSGNVLDSGLYVGGFTACSSQRTCTAVGIDIEATRGISGTMSWRVEIRTINDFGVAISPWSVLATQSRSGSTNTPQRWSYRYGMPPTPAEVLLGVVVGAPRRVEIRLARTDVKDTSPTALSELAWVGLRGYLAQTAPLNADTTHFQVQMRASSQLSQISQHDFALIVQGKCRTWAAGVWGPEIATRNWAWWALDLATSTTWGVGLPDERVDIQSFADEAATADARQDRFDYTFDTAMSAWDALQLIARAGRARVFRRNGILSVARDQLETLPVTAFTSRNTVPGSIQIVEKLPSREQPDGIVIEYEDQRTWEWTPIECPCPGVVSMVTPVRMRLEGVVGATHAEREGLYEAARMLYRTRTGTLRTEMEGVLPAYMAPVLLQPDIVGYGQTGDVALWDVDTLTLTLTEPVTWPVSGDLYLRLRRDDGTLTTPVIVTAGATAHEVVLPAGPDFDLILDDGTRERPIYMLGTLVGGDELVKITAIADGGKGDEGEQLFDVPFVIDDARVHAADNDLLPVGDEVQDPVDTTEDVDSGALLSLPVLSGHTIQDGSSSAAGGVSASFTLTNTGTLTYATASTGSGSFPNEWNIVPISPTQAATAEVRFTILPGNPVFGIGHSVHGSGSAVLPSSAARGAWLGLGTARSIFIDDTLTQDGLGAVVASVLVEIRDATSLIVGASAILNLVVWAGTEP